MMHKTFALRDAFASELRGIQVGEEVNDYTESKKTSPNSAKNITSQAYATMIEQSNEKSSNVIDANSDLKMQTHEFKKKLQKLGINDPKKYKSFVDYSDIKLTNVEQLNSLNSNPDLIKNMYDEFIQNQ